MMNYRDRSLVPDDNEADNKSVPAIYIHTSFTIFSSFPRSSYHPPSTSSSGWKILRREKGTAITMPSCSPPSSAPSSFNYNEAGCPRNEAAI